MNSNEEKIISINNKLKSLSLSKFRGGIHLRKYMIKYIDDKGLDVVKSHAIDFINDKIASANPKNDGKQTPMKGHPVFLAMHACGCCCRSCLYKWHGIPKGRDLTQEEKDYLVSLIMIWIIREYKNNNI